MLPTAKEGKAGYFWGRKVVQRRTGPDSVKGGGPCGKGKDGIIYGGGTGLLVQELSGRIDCRRGVEYGGVLKQHSALLHREARDSGGGARTSMKNGRKKHILSSSIKRRTLPL